MSVPLWVLVLFVGLLGALMLVSIPFVRAKRPGRLEQEGRTVQVSTILAAWRIFVAEEEKTAVYGVLEDYLALIRSALIWGAGLGMLVGALGWGLAGSLTVLVNSQILMLGMVTYVCLILGMLGGLAFTLRLLRRRATLTVRFGDLRQRRAADYRSPWLHLLLLPAYSLILFASITLFVSLGDTSWHLTLFHKEVGVQNWSLLVIPLVIPVLVGGSEILIGRITRFPRFLCSLAPDIAYTFDDLLRATLIGWVFGAEFLAVVGLLWAQYSFISQNTALPSLSTLPLSLSVPLTLAWVAMMLLIVANALIQSRYGRLGGRISRQLHLARVRAAS